MPSIRKRETKDGQVFYEISVSRGRDKSRLTRRWYPPDGWSRKAIERELEQRLEKLLSQIDGVNGVSVMVTLESTSTRIFAEETQSESDSSSNADSSSKSSSSRTEIVLAGGGKEPLETSVVCPRVRGVAVVCPGAADPVVKEKIANTVSGVLNVGVSRVCVTF